MTSQIFCVSRISPIFEYGEEKKKEKEEENVVWRKDAMRIMMSLEWKEGKEK
jgi:hypothetical protein